MPPQSQGIDVSRWQTNVDWGRVRNAGIDFAFCKATENITIVDPNFEYNWREMKRAGILRGAYHFFRPAADALKQAEFCVRTVPLEPGDLPLVLDLENDGGLSRDDLVRVAEIWLTAVERMSGLRPLVYTGPNFWNSKVATPAPPAWAPNYKLWVANYTNAAQPMVPKGWAGWHFWQYTSQGTVHGVSGSVDRDRFNGTTEELRQWAQSVSGAPVATGGGIPVGASTAIPTPVTAAAGDVVQNYFDALNRGDVNSLVAMYSPNAAHVSAERIASGPQEIREWYQRMLTTALPGGQFRPGPLERSGTLARFTWTCRSRAGVVSDGMDTLAYPGGKIMYHTTVFTITTS